MTHRAARSRCTRERTTSRSAGKTNRPSSRLPAPKIAKHTPVASTRQACSRRSITAAPVPFRAFATTPPFGSAGQHELERFEAERKHRAIRLCGRHLPRERVTRGRLAVERSVLARQRLVVANQEHLRCAVGQQTGSLDDRG